MGAFFGATSHRDVVMDVFFGVDYHSHLGTRRAGMVCATSRTGSSARSTPSRTRPSAPTSKTTCRRSTAQAASAASATPTPSRCWSALTWARSPSPRWAPSTTPRSWSRHSPTRRPPVHGHELRRRQRHRAGRRPHQPEGRLRVRHPLRPGRDRRLAHAARHDQRRRDHRRARQAGPPARAHRQGRRRPLRLLRVLRLPQAGLRRRLRAGPARDRARHARRLRDAVARRRAR